MGESQRWSPVYLAVLENLADASPTCQLAAAPRTSDRNERGAT